jgi:hypothetical protein
MTSQSDSNTDSSTNETIGELDSKMNDRIYYSIDGWIPLRNNYTRFAGRSGYSDYNDLEKHVTNEKKIKIMMDDRFNIEDGFEFANDSIICESDDGFKVGDIINLIFNFMVSKIKKEYRNNLALSGFDFDKEKLEVYPNTDS